eukprot:6475003-Amphidinium_carterae.3
MEEVHRKGAIRKVKTTTGQILSVWAGFNLRVALYYPVLTHSSRGWTCGVCAWCESDAGKTEKITYKQFEAT